MVRISVEVDLANPDLCILWELKKRPIDGAMYQLLLGNRLSVCLQPVVVLTDLCEDWLLLWMNESSIEIGRYSSARTAVAIVRSLVKQAEILAQAMQLVLQHPMAHSFHDHMYA